MSGERREGQKAERLQPNRRSWKACLTAQIYGFTTHGLDVALSAAASVNVRNTVINNVGGAGIRVGRP